MRCAARWGRTIGERSCITRTPWVINPPNLQFFTPFITPAVAGGRGVRKHREGALVAMDPFPGQSPDPAVEQRLVADLISMGFSADLSQQAVRSTRGSGLQAALDWLVSSMSEEKPLTRRQTTEEEMLAAAIAASLEPEPAPTPLIYVRPPQSSPRMDAVVETCFAHLVLRTRRRRRIRSQPRPQTRPSRPW